MHEFLKLTKPYYIDPDSRMFMLAGTKHHQQLEEVAKTLDLPAEIPLNVDRDIFDLLEQEEDGWVLTDYKLWGSFKVAKALGLVQVGKKPDPTGAVYKSSGKWGKEGSPKMVADFGIDTAEIDLFEQELQLNRYRVMLADLGVPINRMQLQLTVRDGGTYLAKNRGIERNAYMIPIRKLDDEYVRSYFGVKQSHLEQALFEKKWTEVCNAQENWDGMRCRAYCDVKMFCPKGILEAEIAFGNEE